MDASDYVDQYFVPMESQNYFYHEELFLVAFHEVQFDVSLEILMQD